METAPPPVPAAAPEKNPLAVWSLVMGILSLVCLSIITGIPAIITGHMAFSKSGRLLGKAGRGMALAGLILGYVSVASLPLVAAIVLPAVSKARERAVEMACSVNIRMIEAMKLAYEQEHNGETPASIDVLVKADMLPTNLVCPQDGIYTIGGKDENPACSVHGDLIANPPGTRRQMPVEK